MIKENPYTEIKEEDIVVNESELMEESLNANKPNNNWVSSSLARVGAFARKYPNVTTAAVGSGSALAGFTGGEIITAVLDAVTGVDYTAGTYVIIGAISGALTGLIGALGTAATLHDKKGHYEQIEMSGEDEGSGYTSSTNSMGSFRTLKQ